jgi:hypothetical protein
MYTAPYYIALLTLSFAPLMVTDGHFFPCTNFEFSLSGSLSLFFFLSLSGLRPTFLDFVRLLLSSMAFSFPLTYM